MYDMPKIKLDESKFEPEELILAKKILTGEFLRASHPVLNYEVKGPDEKHPFKYRVFNLLDGSAHYIWRNVVFTVSQRSTHQCMPAMADAYLPLSFDERRDWTKRLDIIVDKIVACVPVTEWHGIQRWAGLL